jgi:cbb3-type cytochrome oxidase maturation protein
MNILLIMIPITLVLSAGFVGAFIWIVRSGQYDDVDTPPYKILTDEMDN